MIFNRERRFVAVILIVSGLALLPSCSDKSSVGKPAQASPAAMPQMPPVPVTVGEASLKTVPVQVRVIGAGEAFSTVNVKSQVDGRVESVHFQ
jgi:multidrug efflux system membrane fusion protein